MAVLKGCKDAGVQRCVITSSVAACQNMASTEKPANRTFNESHWSDPNRPEGMSAYTKSKTFAERKAWEFQASLPDDQKFEIVTILPGMVLGPPICDNCSTSFVDRLM